MRYMLVLFIATSGGVEPTVIEETYPSLIACDNVAWAMKARQPQAVVWWNCERLPNWDMPNQQAEE